MSTQDITCSRMLLVPELLEMVLVHMPPTDLYRYRRVCRTWQNLMQTSPKLRRAMYLNERVEFDAKVTENMTFNPLFTTDLYGGEICNEWAGQSPCARIYLSKEQLVDLIETPGSRSLAPKLPPIDDMLLTNPPVRWSYVTDIWIMYHGENLTCHYGCIRPGEDAQSNEEYVAREFRSRVLPWDWGTCEEEFKIWLSQRSARYRGLVEYVDGDSALTIKPLLEYLKDSSNEGARSWEVLLSLGPFLTPLIPKTHAYRTALNNGICPRSV
ncbi:hypothetical protein NA57DRAFT_71019 [Rhizodiscina lignyota]|uniref:F-box domain-containing protein n=1 Tax=Rhizodiscina lignyota TaxID=1504668 RepID=A0A9P4MGU2_9PEZI|nr:hypothetical protein NA57DRAFT_71019 [Rhizodiscina lignyota]